MRDYIRILDLANRLSETLLIAEKLRGGGLWLDSPVAAQHRRREGDSPVKTYSGRILVCVVTAIMCISLTACGGGTVQLPTAPRSQHGGTAQLTVADIQQQVGADLGKFKKQYSDKRIEVSGYYLGQVVTDYAIGAFQNQDPGDPSQLYARCDAPVNDLADAIAGSFVVVEGDLYSVTTDHIAMNACQVISLTPPDDATTNAPSGTKPPASPSGDSTPPPAGEAFSLQLKNPDGYTYDISGHIPGAGPQFVVDTADAKPGYAVLVSDEKSDSRRAQGDITVTNTTAGRNAPRVGVNVVPVYPLDSAACEKWLNINGDGYSPKRIGLSDSSGQLKYCTIDVDFDSAFPPESATSIPGPLPAGGNSVGYFVLPWMGNLSWGPVLEEDANALVDSMSKPAGWVMYDAGFNFTVTGGSGDFSGFTINGQRKVIWVSSGLML